MGLFNWKKNVQEKHKIQKTNVSGEALDKLTSEGELPFGWMFYNKETVEKIEDELSVFRKQIYNAKTQIDKYAALKSYLMYIEDGKKHYNEIGECEGKYFEEYIINSQETITNKKRFREMKRTLNEK